MRLRGSYWTSGRTPPGLDHGIASWHTDDGCSRLGTGTRRRRATSYHEERKGRPSLNGTHVHQIFTTRKIGTKALRILTCPHGVIHDSSQETKTDVGGDPIYILPWRTPSSTVGHGRPAPTPSRSATTAARRCCLAPSAARARGHVAVVARLRSLVKLRRAA